MAVEHNDLELAEWCLSHGANPNSPPGSRKDRQQTLHAEAVIRGHLDVADALVRYAGRPSTTPLNPMQTLIVAAIRDDHEADDEGKALGVAKLLIEHGADPAIRNPNGRTAADRAERNAMNCLAEFLREFG